MYREKEDPMYYRSWETATETTTIHQYIQENITKNPEELNQAEKLFRKNIHDRLPEGCYLHGTFFYVDTAVFRKPEEWDNPRWPECYCTCDGDLDLSAIIYRAAQDTTTDLNEHQYSAYIDKLDNEGRVTANTNIVIYSQAGEFIETNPVPLTVPTGPVKGSPTGINRIHWALHAMGFETAPGAEIQPINPDNLQYQKVAVIPAEGN